MAIIFFSSIISKAQFQSIINSDSVSWLVKHEIADAWFEKYVFVNKKDSITIDSKKYYETYINYDYSSTSDLVGYFREDTTVGRAWFKGKNDSIEQLVMDLMLKIGDTVWIDTDYSYSSNGYEIVSDVYYSNGRKIIGTKINFGGGYISDSLSFIEGVGPNASILFMIEFATGNDINFQLGYGVCEKYAGDNIVYERDPINHECYYNGTHSIDADGATLQIYPIPAYDQLYISSNFLSIERAYIYNIDGSFMESLSINSNTHTIDISEYTSGLYFIKMGNSITKFIKE